MKITVGYIPPTMPARVIAEIDHKLAVLSDGFGESNEEEAERLRAERGRWQGEADEIRRQHIVHARLMFRRHQELAREHYGRLMRLLQDRGETGGDATAT